MVIVPHILSVALSFCSHGLKINEASRHFHLLPIHDLRKIRGALPGSRLRCWLLWALTNRLFGDQAIFVKREVLENCGGVPDVPLMEEFELCKTIARNGRIALAPATVLTSARKFCEHGTLKTYWLMTRCIVRYWLGASPQRLAEIYYGKNTDAHDVQDEKLLS